MDERVIITESDSSAVKKSRRKKRVRYKSRMITGYIIYASEIRKEVIKKYPDQDFGFISKLVGIEWKNLPQETKIAYEKRAQEQNAKNKATPVEVVKVDASPAPSVESSKADAPTPTTTESLRTNIVYKKPTTVRLRPKDASTQTNSITWVKSKPREPLKFSQKFLDYINDHHIEHLT